MTGSGRQQQQQQKKKCPELHLNCWINQKFWLWFVVLCTMMETLVSPHFTVFLRAAWNGTFHLQGFVSVQMCWGLSHSKAPRQREGKMKSVLPLKSWWHVLLACLREWQLANLKLSSCALMTSQNSGRGPVWFPQSLDHIPSPHHLQVSAPVWLQSDKTRGRKHKKTLRQVN